MKQTTSLWESYTATTFSASRDTICQICRYQHKCEPPQKNPTRHRGCVQRTCTNTHILFFSLACRPSPSATVTLWSTFACRFLEVWQNWTQKPADQYLNTSTLVYSHVSVFTCACVCVCVSGLPRGGASGTDARRFTVWDLMGSGNVLYALSLRRDTLWMTRTFHQRDKITELGRRTDGRTDRRTDGRGVVCACCCVKSLILLFRHPIFLSLSPKHTQDRKSVV